MSYGTSDSYATPTTDHLTSEEKGEIDVSSLTISPPAQRTPHTSADEDSTSHTATYADYHPSAYETVRREAAAGASKSYKPSFSDSGDGDVNADISFNPSTPGQKTSLTDDLSMTPSPTLPPTTQTALPPSTARRKPDPLLHRVLDKNYRIQATPLTARHTRTPGTRTTANHKTNTTTTTTHRPDPTLTFSSSPSIPEAPQLHTEIFSSPLRNPTTSTRKPRRRPAPPHQPSHPRTPGISVLTPGRKPHHRTTKNENDDNDNIWSSDSDLDDSSLPYDRSPPKTMAFHIPHLVDSQRPGRLLQTPARDAAQGIVDDLILTARSAGRGVVGEGEEDFTEDEVEGLGDPTSPSVVGRAVGLEDESF
ncbi:MAG: hypothetical protein Q9227_001552 [Pyrenula ochraceoflavens]